MLTKKNSRTREKRKMIIDIFSLWNLGYWIAGAVILSQNTGARDGCENMWTYCLTCVIMSALLGTSGYAVKKYSENEAQLNISATCTVLVQFIWGLIIYVHLQKDNDGKVCQSFYVEQFVNLWYFFNVSLWSSVVLLGLSICVIPVYAKRQ